MAITAVWAFGCRTSIAAIFAASKRATEDKNVSEKKTEVPVLVLWQWSPLRRFPSKARTLSYRMKHKYSKIHNKMRNCGDLEEFFPKKTSRIDTPWSSVTRQKKVGGVNVLASLRPKGFKIGPPSILEVFNLLVFLTNNPYRTMTLELKDLTVQSCRIIHHGKKTPKYD